MLATSWQQRVCLGGGQIGFMLGLDGIIGDRGGIPYSGPLGNRCKMYSGS